MNRASRRLPCGCVIRVQAHPGGDRNHDSVMVIYCQPGAQHLERVEQAVTVLKHETGYRGPRPVEIR